MDADLFVSILDDELQESIKYYKKKPSDVLFQQDNDPKHKSKIEHLWHHLKTRLGDYERPASEIAELWERVQEEWEAIPASVCQNLISSMPRGVQAVLQDIQSTRMLEYCFIIWEVQNCSNGLSITKH